MLLDTLHFCTLTSLLISSAHGQLLFPIQNWNYRDVTNWKNLYPKCGYGQQTPIDIPVDTIDTCLEPLRIENLYWPHNNIMFQNEYRGSRLHLDTVSYPVLATGGPLPKGVWFYAVDLYFNVGTDDTTGSDHTLQGVNYPMEIKIDLTTALVSHVNTTTAVLSYFVVVSPEDNEAWEPIIQSLSRIRVGGTQTTVSISSLADLLPPYSKWETSYYSYLGTWAAPPCDPKVTRIIYTTFIKLSERQIHQFRLLQDESGRPIINNVRRPMPTLDYRPVLHTSTISY